MMVYDGFVDAVVQSPLGVCWLAVLEAGARDDGARFRTPAIADPSSVSAAVDRVATMSFGSIVEAAVFAGLSESGPWVTDAPARVSAAYRHAEKRAPIAEAIADRFGDQLHAPLARDRQQWFNDGLPKFEAITPSFVSLDSVYGAGEFTRSGLWTATEPPPEALVEMIGTWEYETGPITRWLLPVEPDARVFEVHRPTDWVRLLSEHPRLADPHPGWELPGINQRRDEIAPLLDTTGQRAARWSVRHHVVPDWPSVSIQYDGVHLSWAGFITSEGYVTDLGEGDVTMLRYWASERTLWLSDVFGEPVSTPDPQINLWGSSRTARPPSFPATPTLIARLLGRPTRQRQR